MLSAHAALAHRPDARQGTNVGYSTNSQATPFCAIGAASLFAHFLPQLGGLVTELGELLVLRSAEIADALVTVSSLTPGVRPCCVAFNDCGGQIPAQRAGFLPDGVVDNACVAPFVPNCRIVIGAGDRALSAWHGRPRVVTHWLQRLRNPHEPADLLDDAAGCIATCLPRDHAVVAFDSLLNQKLLSSERLRTALAGLPDSHEWMMELIDPGCGSGLETLVRLNLRGHNVRVHSQAHIPGIGWVDLLVGDRLVIELDSRTHHDSPTAYERDRTRDLALVELGYIVVRATYSRIMHDWATVERALLAIVRRQEHRWLSVHRRAGLAVTID